jgi:hypothetical protein
MPHIVVRSVTAVLPGMTALASLAADAPADRAFAFSLSDVAGNKPLDTGSTFDLAHYAGTYYSCARGAVLKPGYGSFVYDGFGLRALPFKRVEERFE